MNCVWAEGAPYASLERVHDVHDVDASHKSVPPMCNDREA